MKIKNLNKKECDKIGLYLHRNVVVYDFGRELSH